MAFAGMFVFLSSAGWSFRLAEIGLGRWLSIGGLAMDLLGALVLASGLFISKKMAVDLSVARWGPDKWEDHLQQPQVRDRLKQSKRAKVGVALLGAGFVLQMIGSCIR